jgi:hypothetical protein
VKACQDALQSCLAAGGSADDCFASADRCVKAAFDQGFADACTDAQAKCSAGSLPQPDCDDIQKHCSEGAHPPPANLQCNN